MRRKDREITDCARIDEIITACDCVRLAFADGDDAYIVPLNFAFVSENGKRTFYFHSAKEGRKLDLIKKLGRAGFELDTGHALNPGETACGYSYRFQSVVGNGKISVVEDEAEKRRALDLLMERYTGKNSWMYEKAELRAVAVFRLEVESISCKEHK
jgi:nitroimidazol reductase NimA-like FMN-containing flavoprotein (pyridoxamine 5'-phosphate oxidase superfamily)